MNFRFVVDPVVQNFLDRLMYRLVGSIGLRDGEVAAVFRWRIAFTVDNLMARSN
jgi:hypothetical protein